MNLKFILILGLPFISTSRKEFLEILSGHINKQQKSFVVTANPEIVMHSIENDNYKENLDKADYIIADGIGIVKASELAGTPLPERVSGYDVMTDLFQLSQTKKHRVFLLGATQPILEETVDTVLRKYPGIQIAGYQNGYFKRENDAEVVQKIKDSDADMVFVALGCPLQENWIADHIDQFEKGIFMGVGGGFDVLSGNVKRAPDSWIKLNLEWFYRFIKQPSRWRRMLFLPKFAITIIYGKLFKKI